MTEMATVSETTLVPSVACDRQGIAGQRLVIDRRGVGDGNQSAIVDGKGRADIAAGYRKGYRIITGGNDRTDRGAVRISFGDVECLAGGDCQRYIGYIDGDGLDSRGIDAVGYRQAQGVGAGRIEVEVGIVSNTQLTGSCIYCKDVVNVAGSDRPAGKRGCGINVGGGYTAKREAVGCIFRDAEGLGRIDRRSIVVYIVTVIVKSLVLVLVSVEVATTVIV